MISCRKRHTELEKAASKSPVSSIIVWCTKPLLPLFFLLWEKKKRTGLQWMEVGTTPDMLGLPHIVVNHALLTAAIQKGTMWMEFSSPSWHSAVSKNEPFSGPSIRSTLRSRVLCYIPGTNDKTTTIKESTAAAFRCVTSAAAVSGKTGAGNTCPTQ